MTDDLQKHWNNVYTTKDVRTVSWFEAAPTLSLALIAEAGFGREAHVVDVGGGASVLVDYLVRAGQAHVTVLDLSSAAMDLVGARLGAHQRHVHRVACDVTQWHPDRHYDVWHDRAVLHFLTDPAQRQKYADVLASALRVGGVAIIGTFATDGPERCSGLAVQRHDQASLAAMLGPAFDLRFSRTHAHTTPGGAVQKFQFSTFSKIA